MKQIAVTLVLALATIAGAQAAYAQAAKEGKEVDKPVTITDANLITEAALAKLPHMNAALAKRVLAKRPFKTSKELDTALAAAGLTKDQRTELYAKVFVPINLNTATDEEIQLIPGVGNRMLREFKEYRPYTALAQFHREIGKYVDNTELARLEQYVYVPAKK
jgi:DNA uptake protein ComE-like DNA-binding protein